MRTRDKGNSYSLTFDLDSHNMIISNISIATWSVGTKFHVEFSGAKQTKICSNGPGHMTNMAPMAIHS